MWHAWEETREENIHGKNLTEKEHLEGLGAHGRIILKWILGKANEPAEWIRLAQGRQEWRSVFKGQ